MHILIYRIPEMENRPHFILPDYEDVNPTAYLQTGVFYQLWIDPRTNQAEFLVNYESVYVSELIAHRVGFQIIYD